jgi:hypothetical protein
MLRSALGMAVAGSIAALVATPGAASAVSPPAAVGYSFRTYDNSNDASFNQLLGINRDGVIAGYFGSGARDHPNKGYLLNSPYGQASYQVENYPHGKQTQVTGLNDTGTTVGFWSDQNKANLADDNFGFYSINGAGFESVVFPTSDNSAPLVNQLLGVNDSNIAVGFYTDSQGQDQGYEYNITSNTFSRILVPGATSTVVAGINNLGNVAGFSVGVSGATTGFLLRPGGQLTTLAVPGATTTEALGISGRSEVVGFYQNAAGAQHGFTWTLAGGFQTVDDPHGVGTTVINGVNNDGYLVGFYVGRVGNTDGFLARPVS